jgi:hypothetical protein
VRGERFRYVRTAPACSEASSRAPWTASVWRPS